MQKRYGGFIMKRFTAIALAALMLLSLVTLVACGKKNEGTGDMEGYVAPSYKVDTATGVITYADGVGETAIITGYEPKVYTPHKISIPDKIGERTVTAIGDEAFKACASMNAVEIPATVTSIGKAAFYACDALTEITLPASLKTVSELAFASCTALAKVNIADNSSLIKIENNAFDSCIALESFKLPAKLQLIGEGAFRNCEKLSKVEIPESVLEIGSQAYVGCDALNYDGCIVLTDKIENLGGFDPEAKDPAVVVIFETDKSFIKAPENSYAAAFVAAMRDTSVE